MHSGKDWAYIDIKINNSEMFGEVYGWAAGDEVIRFAALLINEIVDSMGTTDDYVGHPGRDNFVIISHAEDVDAVKEKLTKRFEEEVKQHYSFIDRERGYMLAPDGANGENQVELMTFSIGVVSTRTHQFSDIREITELAAEDRRRSRSGESGASDEDSNILTQW
jgi:GGDEF domain-containing protein